MEGPKIVFCDNNHIYDAGIYNECPYCKKISEDQALLSSSVSDIQVSLNGGSNERKRQWNVQDDCEDGTELIHHNDYETDESDETELFSRESDEKTELLKYQSQSGSNYGGECNRETACYVLGWLVCLKGNNKGRSFEILSNSNNRLCVGNNRKMTMISNNLPANEILLEIQQSDSSGRFKIKGFTSDITINGVPAKQNETIGNYDMIAIKEYKFLLVSIITEFINWGE